MDMATGIVYGVVFLFGIVVGSFLNVCILRIPAGESVVTVPSHCMSCGKHLKWYELIPLFSWLALGGKCSGCKARISPQYPLIEAANGILWMLALKALGPSLETLLCALLLSTLLVVGMIDARTREIPPSTVISVAVLGGLRLILDLSSWSSALLGAFVISVPLFLIFVISKGRAIGGGDVKLMAAAGLFLGWKLCLVAFGTACILGAVIHLIRMKFFGAGRELALGPYLSAGCALAVLWGEAFLRWYTGLYAL